jgi:hypothetical protein
MSGTSAFFFAALISIGTGFETGRGLCMMVEGRGNHEELGAVRGVTGRKLEEGFTLTVVLRMLWNSSFTILFSLL